jgi:hypothetical protein
LLENIDADSIRVYAPTQILFVCGGETNASSTKILSLRDAFMRLVGDPPFVTYQVIIAEQLPWFFPKGDYKDILLLESDIAQISDLVLLFSESFGSACELGAFSTVDEIARRLLVFIDDINAKDQSFVALGPLRALQNLTRSQSVCVLDHVELGFGDIQNVKDIRLSTFSERVASAIRQRKPLAEEHKRLDVHRSGHILKLAVGLIQHYSALTLDEICDKLSFFVSEIDRNRIRDLLLCAEFAEWVAYRPLGINTYYVSTANKPAMSFKLESSSPRIDRLRWRSDIVEHWKQTDPERFTALRNPGGPRP